MGIMKDELHSWIARNAYWQHICSGEAGVGLVSDRFLTPRGGAVVVEYKKDTGEITHVKLVNDFTCPTAKEG